jgi:hypothetical protein
VGIVARHQVAQKIGGKRYLRICAFASATLQQNRTDTEKNTKDTV